MRPDLTEDQKEDLFRKLDEFIDISNEERRKAPWKTAFTYGAWWLFNLMSSFVLVRFKEVHDWFTTGNKGNSVSSIDSNTKKDSDSGKVITREKRKYRTLFAKNS